MPLTLCPECGESVSLSAIVCPHCGFPIRPDKLPGGAASRSSAGKALAIVAVTVAALFGVGFVGVLAAIAIPRFSQAAERAREIPGQQMLRRAYAAEQSFHAQHGRYTGNKDELVPVLAPAPPVEPVRYDLEISAASDRDLCLEAVPRAGYDARPLSMDANGALYRSAGCSGDPYRLYGGVPAASGVERGYDVPSRP